MATTRLTARPGSEAPAPAGGGEFRETFGEELRHVLDVGTWQPGWDLAREYPRIEREVRDALAQEDEDQRGIRTQVFPRLFNAPAVPPGR